MFTLKCPIIQAPIGGIATPELAAAVSNAGGLGGLAFSWASHKKAEEKIRNFQALSSQPMYANFVLNFQPKALERTLELGVKIIQFLWGMPSKQMVSLIKLHDAKMGIQVTSKQSAAKAIVLGADYLICQGTQAGGHLQASKNLEKALIEVLEETTNKIPVFASGGISSGKDLYHYMKLGAAGVVMGTRFVASKESAAHTLYKETLVKSEIDDTVFTVCMNKGWNNSAHRIIRDSTFNMWESDGCAIEGNRPGEYDILGISPTGKEVERYSISAPTTGVTGKIEAMAFYAGTSVNGIQEIKSAGKIVEDIWNEHQALTK